MKKSTLFELAIKITGLIALWHAVMSSPSLFAGFSILSSTLSNFSTQGGFMAILGISMFLNVAVAAFFAYLCLMKTGTLMRLFKFDTDEELDLKTDKTILFDVAVFLAAILMLISGLTNLVSYDYKKDYKTETVNQFTDAQTATNQVSTNSTVLESQTKHVNYFAIVQILAGVFLLSNGAAVSSWLTRRYGYDNMDAESVDKKQPEEFSS